MYLEIRTIAEFALTTIIAGATIWIAITANRISKMQLERDLARQKLDWCRACLQSVSQAVTLASYSQTEIVSLEFEKARRQLRGKIISFKNEGEMFLTAKDQDPTDVASLHSLRRCYKAMGGDLQMATA